jgi:hypothetical protein
MRYLLEYDKTYVQDNPSCKRTYKYFKTREYGSGISLVFSMETYWKFSKRETVGEYEEFVKNEKIYCQSRLGIVTEGEILPEGLTQILTAAVGSDTETVGEAKMRISEEALASLEVELEEKEEPKKAIFFFQKVPIGSEITHRIVPVSTPISSHPDFDGFARGIAALPKDQNETLEQFRKRIDNLKWKWMCNYDGSGPVSLRSFATQKAWEYYRKKDEKNSWGESMAKGWAEAKGMGWEKDCEKECKKNKKSAAIKAAEGPGVSETLSWDLEQKERYDPWLALRPEILGKGRACQLPFRQGCHASEKGGALVRLIIIPRSDPGVAGIPAKERENGLRQHGNL